jgi:L-rhamnose isomerase/sugar isomerase
MTNMIDAGLVADQNAKLQANLQADYDALGGMLARRGLDIEQLTSLAQTFEVAVPSWGAGTGGTRFARFPGRGEPRNVFEKLEDCGVINQLTRATPAVSLHFPWDKPSDAERTAPGRGQPGPRLRRGQLEHLPGPGWARNRPTNSAA